jgi:hypothetical protein
LLTRKTEVWLTIRSRRACEGATEKTEALLRSANAELRRAYFALVLDC